MKPTTFRSLVTEKYLPYFSQTFAFRKIAVEAMVDPRSVEAAFDGTRVLPDTASDLEKWARHYHRVQLDVESLLRAPSKQKKGAV